jgi:ABC-type glycerol-3-phosphate transport system substrate-binding protein
MFASDSVTAIPYQAEAFQAAGNQDEWTVMPFPSPNRKPAFDVYGPSYILLKSTPERQLASWLFVRWLAASQNQARLAEATGSLPLRTSVFEQLSAYRVRYPAWQAIAQQLSAARGEPKEQSWRVVRWALGDATTQLFRSYFTMDQIPGLIDFLDRTAADLQHGPNIQQLFATNTLTPLPPTRTPVPTQTPTPSRTPAATPAPSQTANPR